jgi:DNA-binding MurR/RpiR family transcriptional regulator
MNDTNYPSLNAMVESYNGRLTGSDRAILAILLSTPKSAVFSSVAQLAELAGVHKSTVVRLANKLGFDGYPELRAKIRSEVHPEATLEKRSQQRLNSIEQGSNLNALIESEIAALNAISESLSQAQIDIAADHLANARTIHMVGRGSAGPLVMHLDRRLRRIGFQTNVAVNLQRRDLAEKFMALSEHDAVVFFAFQAPNSLPEGYDGLIKHVAEIGAKSIVVSDSTGPTIRPRADVLLSVCRPDEGVMQLRTGPIVVCEALAMTLAHKDPKRVVKGLEGLEGLRANLLTDKGKS